jgi:hypothetical protein
VTRARRGWFLSFGLATVGLLLAAVVAPALAAEGVYLVPRFEAGQRLRYRMQLTVETESSLSPLGQAVTSGAPLRLAIDMTWEMEALEVEPSGNVRLRAHIEALTIESSVPTARPSPVEEFTGKSVGYRLLADGSVDTIEAPPEWLEDGQPPEWLRTWLEQASGAGASQPAHPVVPGDHWQAEQEFEVPGLPRQRLTSESEYLRDEEVNGRACAAILTRFELAGADSHVPESAAGPQAAVERSVEGDGSRLSCYDHRSGLLLESSQKSREHIRLEIRDHDGGATAAPTVLESRTTTESHLRVVD